VTDVFDPAYAERLQAVAPDEGLRRREFLERTARAAGVGLGLAAALGPDRLIADAAEGRTARRTGRDIPIDIFGTSSPGPSTSPARRGASRRSCRPRRRSSRSRAGR
jgi:hypothetical protein